MLNPIWKPIQFILLLLLFISCSERGKVVNPNESNDPYYTEISGNINGTLSASNSPYLVTDEIIVGSSDELQIEPGVTLHFTDSSNMLIMGKLVAVGTKDDLITFSAQNNLWKGISFSYSNQSSIIQFAIIEKVVLSYLDSTDFGALQLNNSNITIKNCIIRDNEAANGGGITVLESDVVITNNIFRENYALVHGAGLLLFQSNSIITNNTFYNNYSVNCGAAISILASANDSIQNNILYKNLSQGICPQFYYSNQDSANYTILFNFDSMNDPDPKFINTEDLRLSPNSPCINNGNPNQTYNDTNGTRNDQGAYGGPDGDW